MEKFGEQTPFCEPYWYQGYHSPYYTESHIAFRAKCRAFVEQEILPNEEEWLESGKGYPYKELHRKGYEAGVLGVIYPSEYGGTPIQGYNAFHELIQQDEFARSNVPGVLGQHAINSMALPPVLNCGSEFLKQKVAHDVIVGDKTICLAISEPGAGSDVANIQTSAVREGNHYVINGAKKWITGGLWGDYFTMACRTGGPGMLGISFLLVDRDTPGINIRQMKTQAGGVHNTSFITLEDARVPVDHLIGEENKGFMVLVQNFNHERFVIAAGTNRSARKCYEEAVKWAQKRKTFGKRLIDHQVIRAKLAEMVRLIEATHDNMERVAHQYACGVPDAKMGGACALLKVMASRTFEFCAREASQIFGGSSIVQEGPGMVVERLYRGVRASAIPGGSEEILLDFAMRNAKL